VRPAARRVTGLRANGGDSDAGESKNGGSL